MAIMGEGDNRATSITAVPHVISLMCALNNVQFSCRQLMDLLILADKCHCLNLSQADLCCFL